WHLRGGCLLCCVVVLPLSATKATSTPQGTGMAEMEQEPLGVSREESQLSGGSDEKESAAQLKVLEVEGEDIGGADREQAHDTAVMLPEG
ncbi:unnamed protein product, partial [Ectocarpus fasciculatus]